MSGNNRLYLSINTFTVSSFVYLIVLFSTVSLEWTVFPSMNLFSYQKLLCIYDSVLIFLCPMIFWYHILRATELSLLSTIKQIAIQGIVKLQMEAKSSATLFGINDIFSYFRYKVELSHLQY
jgi:hypothetical protein